MAATSDASASPHGDMGGADIDRTPFQSMTEQSRRYAVPVVGLVAGAALLLSTLKSHGPSRYYPLFLVAIIGVLAVVNILAEALARPSASPASTARNITELVVRNRRGLLAAVTIIAYWYAVPWLGFFIATALMIVACARILGVPLLRTLVLAAVLLVCAYLLFSRAAHIPLPPGYFGWAP